MSPLDLVIVAGVALPNASAMRVARVRRALADEDEGRLALGEPDLVRTVRSAGYALDSEGLA